MSIHVFSSWSSASACTRPRALAAQLGLAFHIQALCLPMCRQQQRVHGLEAEAAALERQNAAMTMLLSGILSTGACPPAAASQDALEVWLATQLPGGC